MKTVQQLNQERETAQTELFKQVRLFWAFSNQQLEEGKKQIGKDNRKRERDRNLLR
jgi:hypothetical protein